MERNTGKLIALSSIGGFLLSIFTLPQWLGHCNARYPEPLTTYVIVGFSVLMVFSRRPLITLFICLLWAPIYYAVATEPCTPPRSQGAGGLLYLLVYVAVPIILGVSFLFGALAHLVFPIRESQQGPEV